MLTIFPVSNADGAGSQFKAAEDAATLAADNFRVTEVVFAEPPRVSSRGQADVVQVDYSVSRNHDDKWTFSLEKNFARLAAKIAGEEATKEELKEFAELQKIRRRTRNPLTAEEIIFDFKRRKLEADIVASLHRYVEFIEAPRR